ncbi:ORF2 [Wisteria badnavirus 1]|uniref:ORF2 n=1 Tax=Wisteria badnavirus 1 TaxID=1973265 RepID=A0A1U9IRR3_9VIRU|nr:ORF2 [Wisteria badnavirus 1]AQM50986.1 ORF2 [Wisteria badnavirus 1]
MSSWISSSETSVYKDTLEAVSTLSGDHEGGEGFVKPDTLGSKGITHCVKQNNFQIQILVQITKRLEDIQLLLEKQGERINALEKEVKTLKTADFKVPEDVIDDLTKKFAAIETSALKKAKQKVTKEKTPFLIHHDPYELNKSIKR